MPAQVRTLLAAILFMMIILRTLAGKGIDEVKTNSLKSLADEICISDYDCIGVDEGQFVRF